LNGTEYFEGNQVEEGRTWILFAFIEFECIYNLQLIAFVVGMDCSILHTVIMNEVYFLV